MSGIMVLKYKKTLRIVGICIICWLYALAFAALASSCGGEAESIGGNTAKTALLRLSISGTNAAKTRATAAALPENEATVHRLTIGLFYADGSVNTIAEPAIEADGTTGTLAVEGILCSPGTCDVIVVGKRPRRNVCRRTDQKRICREKCQSGANCAQRTAGIRPLAHVRHQRASGGAGNREVGFRVRQSVPSGGAYLHCEHPQRIQPELCRCHIYIRPHFSVQCAGSFPRFARRHNPNHACQAYVAARRYDERAADGSFLWTEGAGFLLNDVTPSEGIPITSDEYTVPYWFYAFANNDAANRTKLVLSGYFDPDGSTGPKAPVYVYYPIVVNRSQTGTVITPSGSAVQNGVGDGTIVRNRDYRIKAVIKGDGEPTPGTEVVPSSLELTVSVDDWTLKIVQEVELN